MPLKLLSKKSWHVGNADNIARVKRDEAAELARAMELKAQQVAADLSILRERAGLSAPAASADQPAAHAPQRGGKQPVPVGAGAATATATTAAAAASRAAEEGVRLGEGSLELGGASQRGIHRYIQGGHATAAQPLAAQDALRKHREDPLEYVRQRLGVGAARGSSPHAAVVAAASAAGAAAAAAAAAAHGPLLSGKRPREEQASAPLTLDQLRRERLQREAAEGAKAACLMHRAL